MKFIIIGAGSVGRSLAKRLINNQHDVVIIEKDETSINNIPATLDLMLVHGDGACPECLTKAGIKNADYVVAVADNDQVNTAAVLIAKLLNPSTKRIARIRNTDLKNSGIDPEVLSEYFDLIINPEKAGADYLFDLFKIPGAQEIIEFAGGELRLLALPVKKDSAFDGIKISSLKPEREKHPFLIVAISRDKKIIVPRGTDRIHTDDLIYIVADPDKTDMLLEKAGGKRQIPKNAVIWGGTMLANFLAKEIETCGTSVKMIVSDEENAFPMLEDSDTILILKGTGTDQNLLAEENIGETDVFIAVSPDEEQNILACLLAKKLGAKAVMALINDKAYRPLISAVGIDAAVSSNVAAAAAIVRHIHTDAVISEFSLQKKAGTFLEIEANEKMPVVNKTIEEINLPYGILITAIVRNHVVIIPDGNEKILAGDDFVVFTLESMIKKLQKILGIKLEFNR